MVVYNFRLPAELLARLENLAESQKRTTSAMGRIILEENIEKYLTTSKGGETHV